MKQNYQDLCETHQLLSDQIDKECAASGNELGWRFLYSPASTLRQAEVAFIGLNPGGKQVEPDHDGFCLQEGYSAYVDETWDAGRFPKGQAPLQKQVCALFERLKVAPHEVLAGNLIPFRSPELKSMKNKDACMKFSAKLWSAIFKNVKPKLVVCMGRDTEKSLVKILRAQDAKRVSVGWGRISGRCYEFEGGRLVALPHLSRFALMKRQASQAGLDELFSE